MSDTIYKSEIALEHDRASRTKRVMLYGWNPNTLEATRIAVDGNGSMATDYQTLILESGSYTYICKSLPGTSTATAGWQVARIDADGSKMFADANADFDNIASDPTALSYSYS